MNRGTKATPSPAGSKFLTAGSHTAIQSLFQWDSWEVRLLHPETKQLELFVSHNLAPLRIGESIFAAARGNGITGRVAATGQCVLTRQADTDEEYLPGLEGAQSTMTLRFNWEPEFSAPSTSNPKSVRLFPKPISPRPSSLGDTSRRPFTSSSWCSASVRRSIVKQPVPSVAPWPTRWRN